MTGLSIDTPAKHIYTGDGTTRVFPIPTYIQGDDWIRIEIDGVYVVDRRSYDIVNNSIIFVTAPGLNTQVSVQVATSIEALSQLGNSTNVDIVAGYISNVNTVATNIDNVNTTSENILGINQIVDNLPEILLADGNATIATTKANEALASALSASTSADEASDSALSASTSASQALTSRNQAETFAQQAQVSASVVQDIIENKVETINTITDLRGYSNTQVKAVNVLGYHTKGDDGGGAFYWDATSTEIDNGGTIIQAAGIPTGRWKRVIGNYIDIRWFGAVDDATTTNDIIGTWTGTNNAPYIQAAIDSLAGTYDLGSAYIFESVPTIKIPIGKFGVSDEIFINKNNIRIVGDGFFNTSIICLKTSNIESVIRFQGAYGCELSDITIDGGLPFTPGLSENYGADIGVVLDQVALFTSRSLNIMNTRYEGKRCIHLWESYFDNLRIGNVGFFGTLARPSAAIRFTLDGKQDNTFPGGESNNISYNKISIGAVGSYLRTEVPVYNLYFNDITAEGRTWSVNYESLAEDKWILGSTSSNIVIQNGYTFAHYQPFNNPVSLFNINNVGQGVKISNYHVYSEADNTYPEIDTIVEMYNDYPIDVNISVTEIGSSSLVMYKTTNVVYKLQGNINYVTDGTRTRLSLFSDYIAESAFLGTLYYKTSSGTNIIDYSSYANASQKMIDMTPYRVANVTYTNTNPYPLQIVFECGNPIASGSIYITLGTTNTNTAQATNNGYAICTGSVTVPPNTEYSYRTIGNMQNLRMLEMHYQ